MRNRLTRHRHKCPQPVRVAGINMWERVARLTQCTPTTLIPGEFGGLAFSCVPLAPQRA
ncbi:hypothetical protein PSAB6_70285 [Paraburkholderia sabiae]|nr:hypothetical protein PSAB6_70285 [Paraburkholderia sabiae]